MKLDKHNFNTNNVLAELNNTTPRQISKSRKRGYFRTNDNKIVKESAPKPLRFYYKKGIETLVNK